MLDEKDGFVQGCAKMFKTMYKDLMMVFSVCIVLKLNCLLTCQSESELV